MSLVTASDASAGFVLKTSFRVGLVATITGGAINGAMEEDCDYLTRRPPCTQVQSTVALVRGGTTVAESAPSMMPIQQLPGPPQPGDVVSLRRNGAEVASATWAGAPTIDSGADEGSATIAGTKEPGTTLTASTATGASATVADGGSTYTATFPAAPACDTTLSVSATRQTYDEPSGTSFGVTFSRSTRACPGGPYPRLATLGVEGSDLIQRPTGTSGILVGLNIGSTVGAGSYFTSYLGPYRKGTVAPGQGCSRPAGWSGPVFQVADVTCPATSGAVRALLGDASDRLLLSGAGQPVAVSLAGGDDTLQARNVVKLDLTADGGADRDTFKLDGTATATSSSTAGAVTTRSTSVAGRARRAP